MFRFRSPGEFVDFFRANYGPVHTAFAKLDGPGRTALRRDLTALVADHDRGTGASTAVPSEYLEVIATRRLA